MTPPLQRAPIARLALVTLVASIVSFGVGMALGALSWSFMVLGLQVLVTGLVVGIASATLLVAQGLRAGGARLVVALAIAVTAGWIGMRVIEDGHIVSQYRAEVARARASSTGLTPSELEAALAAPDALDFWARGAAADLDRQVEAEVGFAGPVGRWWWRAGNGVPLAGSWTNARGLPVGRAGALLVALLELALATWIARRVVVGAATRAGTDTL